MLHSMASQGIEHIDCDNLGIYSQIHTPLIRYWQIYFPTDGSTRQASDVGYARDFVSMHVSEASYEDSISKRVSKSQDSSRKYPSSSRYLLLTCLSRGRIQKSKTRVHNQTCVFFPFESLASGIPDAPSPCLYLGIKPKPCCPARQDAWRRLLT